jgi:hypothetical protein
MLVIIAVFVYLNNPACSGHASWTGKGGLYTSGTSLMPYWVNGGGTCYSFYTSSVSDHRFKQNLCCWSVVCCTTNIIKSVPVYSFNWNEGGVGHNLFDTVNTPRVGFLAHEVQEKLNVNNLVSGTKDELTPHGELKPQSVNQIEMIPILWSALQETIKRVETLEAEVEALKNS